MSNENKIDNEKHFPALDAGKPTEDWERFDRDLMSYLGGKADKSGSSPADHLHDVDMGGMALGAPAFPGGGGNAVMELRRLRDARNKIAYATMYNHLGSKDLQNIAYRDFGQPGAVDARGMYLWLKNLYHRFQTRGAQPMLSYP